MSSFLILVFCSFTLFFCTSQSVEQLTLMEDEFRKQRIRMVESQLQSRDIRNPLVLEAMKNIPRHLFMPEETRRSAYADNPVPIGERQTISQPYIVALMTQTVDPRPEHRALEIGTGSGYQAAVLAELVGEVYSIEIISMLASRARRTLSQLDYKNVTVREGDGYAGWPGKSPFDIILVTAAAETIPQPLIDQLAEGGKLVMPVGSVSGIQALTLLTKRNGKVQRNNITGVRFVPMIGKVQRE